MKVVADGNTLNRADLVLPLAWHDLSVGARDSDASVEASLVVSVGDSATEAVGSSYRAVVGTLGTGVTILGPAKRPRRELSLSTDERVLLLDAEPRLFVSGVEDFLGVNAEISQGGLEVLASAIGPLVGVAHDEQVLAAAEGIAEHSDRAHDDLRVVGGGLVAGRAIVVPLGALVKSLDLAWNRSALGAESDAAAVKPDVLENSGVLDFLPSSTDVHVLVVEGKVSVVSHD